MDVKQQHNNNNIQIAPACEVVVLSHSIVKFQDLARLVTTAPMEPQCHMDVTKAPTMTKHIKLRVKPVLRDSTVMPTQLHTLTSLVPKVSYADMDSVDQITQMHKLI